MGTCECCGCGAGIHEVDGKWLCGSCAIKAKDAEIAMLRERADSATERCKQLLARVEAHQRLWNQSRDIYIQNYQEYEDRIRDLEAEIQRITEEGGAKIIELEAEVERLEKRRAILCPDCTPVQVSKPLACDRCGREGAVIVDGEPVRFTPDGRYLCEHCGGTGDVRNATGGGEAK